MNNFQIAKRAAAQSPVGSTDLPAVEHGECKTLCVKYEDGTTLKVPYFDRQSAMSFLALEEDVTGWWIESFKG